MKILMHWSFIPVLAVLLFACDGVIVEDFGSNSANYSDGDFDMATVNGEIATVVVGNPFSQNSSTFDDRVRTLMKNQIVGFPISFVSRHGANTTKPYKVVVVFNPRRDVDNRMICRKGKQTPMTSGHPGQVSVAMSFCDGKILKSGTRGRVGNITGENDPKFIALVQQVTDAMVPSVGAQRFRER